MVGRLLGMVTITPGAGGAPLTGKAALALATTAFASERASAFASAFASTLAFAVAAVFAAVWLWSLSSFCSSIFNCCFSSAISCSLLLADWAWACEAARAPARPIAAAAILVLLTSPLHRLDQLPQVATGEPKNDR